MSEENKQLHSSVNPLDPWIKLQEEQTKLWMNYWTGVMNSLFNTDLNK